MQNLTDHINIIEEKVRLVLQKMDELNASNTVLIKENNRLRSLLTQHDVDSNGHIQAKSTSTSANMDIEGIKKELDHYIEEIDQTIELLKAS